MHSTGVYDSLLRANGNGQKKVDRDVTAQLTTSTCIAEAHCQYSAMSVSRGVIATITHCIRARIRKADEERAKDRDDVENGNTIRKNGTNFQLNFNKHADFNMLRISLEFVNNLEALVLVLVLF